MGIFAVNIRIAKPPGRPTFTPARRLMVDTGSEVTWIAARTLEKAGIAVRKKDQPFVMANGEHITRDVGYAMLRCGSFETIDEVVFAHPGDLQLLGARTLEGFSAVVDARGKRLVAAGPMPAAGGSLPRTGGPPFQSQVGSADPTPLISARIVRPCGCPRTNAAYLRDTIH